MFIQAIFLILVTSMTNPEAMEIKSEHFIARHQKSSARTARMAIQSAEMAHKSVKKVLDIEAPAPVLIVIIPSKGKFGKSKGPAASGSLPDWAVGAARASRLLILLRQPYGVDISYADIAEVVIHEYTHIAVGNFLEEVEVPLWFDEGVADFVGGKRSWSASFTIGMAALTGRLIPMRYLDYRWPESRSDVELAYAEASDFVIYIENNHGPGAIRRIVHETGKVKDLDAAVKNITGKGLEELEKDWLKQVLRVYRWLPLLTGGVTIWTLGSLLVIIGYFRKKKIARLKYQLWEMEEKLAGMAGNYENEDEEESEDENPPTGYSFH